MRGVVISIPDLKELFDIFYTNRRFVRVITSNTNRRFVSPLDLIGINLFSKPILLTPRIGAGWGGFLPEAM